MNSSASPFRRRLLLSYRRPPADYLCFTALVNGTFTFSIGSLITTSMLPSVSYSLDGGETWVTTPNQDSVAVTITTPTITAGNSVLWKAKGRVCYDSGANRYSRFSSTGTFNVSGCLNSLLYEDTFSTNIYGDYVFFGLFFGSKVVDASKLILPNSTTIGCYYRLFRNCSSLTSAPNLSNIIYNQRQCMSEMFYYCRNLNSEITLNESTPSTQGLMSMMYNCPKINYIKMLSTNVSASNCLNSWVYKVASTGIFVKHIDATWTNTGTSGVPTNWTVIYYDPSEDKYYTSQDKSQECDDHGNII